ncbi:MAG TPA: hypothetical protein VGQ46_20860 [Thermoanaerobaculia bacterium]|nr:hypothetical protein [Thermoanaerobaculia bacterium]
MASDFAPLTPFATCLSIALRASLIFGAAAFLIAFSFGLAAFSTASYASSLALATAFPTFFAAFWTSF